MAEKSYSTLVAARLFLLVVGTLFIWEAVPSTRWTYDLSPNMQTGLWKACSCQFIKRNPETCNIEYSYLQGAYFATKGGNENVTDNTANNTAEYKSNKQFQYLFRERVNSENFTWPAEDRKLHGAPQFTQDQWDTKISLGLNIYKTDKDQCARFQAIGPIALVTYIFAFIAFVLVIRNIASNKLPVLDGGVYVCVIMTGIWGLITTVMFGELFARSEGHAPLGHQFAIFTTAWILFFVVGVSGVTDAKKGQASSSVGAAVRSALFVAALVGFAYSMGNDWAVTDNQFLIAPLGGFQWTIKGNSFFIAPAEHAPYITQASMLHLHNRADERDAVYCDNSGRNETTLRAESGEGSHLTKGKYMERRLADAPRAVTGRQEDAKTNQNHFEGQCITQPKPHVVRGEKVTGLWKRCYCKETTSEGCSLFGSYWPMFNGRDQKCDTFGVARAMILMTGIFAFLSLVMSSMLIGGLRNFTVHALSNNLCFLCFLLGLISSILYGGVIYPVGRLSADFALYLAGWILVFFAGILGYPIGSYYNEVSHDNMVIPMETLPSNTLVAVA